MLFALLPGAVVAGELRPGRQRTVASALAVGQSDGVQLNIELLEQSSLLPHYDDGAPTVANGETSILRGDIVGIQVRLENSGSAESAPTLLSRPQKAGWLEIEVTRPDGTKLLVPWASRPLDCSVTKARPLAAGESISINGYLFEYDWDDSRGRSHWDYVFEEPGTYTIAARYWVGTPRSRLEWGDQGEDPATSQYVESANTLTVTVQEETIPAWQELKDAEILQCAGNIDWPFLRENAPEAEALVTQSEQPWLREWVDRLKGPDGQ